MALIPSRQFYPANTRTPASTIFGSLQSSFSKFHGVNCIDFIRYNRYSISGKSHTTIASHSTPDQNISNKPDFIAGNSRTFSSHISDGNSSREWLGNWSKAKKENLPKPPRAVVDYQNSDGSSSGGNSTMEKIVEKLKKFGYMDGGGGNSKESKYKAVENDRGIEKGSVEDIFYVEEGMLPNARGGFSKNSPLGVESAFGVEGEVKFPWEKMKEKNAKEGNEDEDDGRLTMRRKSKFSVAELTIPESELRRLKNLTFQIKNRTKVTGAGVTQAIVETIHEKWKTSEIVRVKVDGAPALNMKRMHEILERKTGGLVIWRSGTSVALYRGVSYEDPSLKLNKRNFQKAELPTNSLRAVTSRTPHRDVRLTNSLPAVTSKSLNKDGRAPQANIETTMLEEEKDDELPLNVRYEDEVDELLDGLGPRYTDWQGCDPLPVDADMLPGIVPGYQPPFRVLPYGVRSTIGQKEATSLRRLARVLPPHFALGRSRQLQGLAVAMIKLWENSSIAKIALKRGVQLTTSERMAEDIKNLTGSILLSRNKDFLVFYRGKNFLSPEVAEALLERETLAKSLQDDEEQARLRASAFIIPSLEGGRKSGTAGTLGETLDADAKWGKKLDDHHKEKMMREAERMRHAELVRKLERKLAFAERKVMKAERVLSKVEVFLKPSDRQADQLSISDEERFMFRKLGLKMKAFLLLGRRGVFDGTVENMHLHWKYRELVKIIMNAKSFEEAKKVALALEAESGGILISIDKISKGYSVIVYRGNEYQRPSKLRPANLLTKRKALARSIELQRREALINHISALESKVEKIRSEIKQVDLVKDHGDEELYEKIDAAYSTDDEETESEEEDEAYLETYTNENDEGEDVDVDVDDDEDEDEDEDGLGGLIRSLHVETNFPYDVKQQKLKKESDFTESSENADVIEEEQVSDFP